MQTHYRVQSRELAGSCYIAKGGQPGALWQPRKVRREWRLMMEGRWIYTHTYTYTHIYVIILICIDVQQRRGWQRMRWLDGIHWLNRHESEQAPGNSERRKSDMMQSMGPQRVKTRLNDNNNSRDHHNIVKQSSSNKKKINVKMTIVFKVIYRFNAILMVFFTELEKLILRLYENTKCLK